MKSQNTPDLAARTKAFALRILKLADSMPRTLTADILARQIARSGTSTAANYRAAQRARSKAEFISKLSIVHEEADETCLWIELIEESGMVTSKKTCRPLKPKPTNSPPSYKAPPSLQALQGLRPAPAILRLQIRPPLTYAEKPPWKPPSRTSSTSAKTKSSSSST